MHVTANGLRAHVELAGKDAAPTLMFSHSLGAALQMWEPQLELADRFRLLRYDTRGHGRSEAPDGAYTLDDLVDDAIGVLDALGIDRVWFVGLSMGGMIGQLFALRRPERLHGIVLSGTLSEFPAVAHAAWDDRIRATREHGMEPQVEPAMDRWFTAEFREQHQPIVDRIRAQVRACDPKGYIGCCEAVRGLALTARLDEIRLPTLVMTGADDLGAGPAVAQSIHERIAGSELAVIERASHLCNVERSELFNQRLAAFAQQK
jgi:3-oxoadipate enol-lactonase